jgi:hypothetical protein
VVSAPGLSGGHHAEQFCGSVCWAPEKAVRVDVFWRGRRIGRPGLTQAPVELLVCGRRVHVCAGREAKEPVVRRPGELRPMKQSIEAETEMRRARDMTTEQHEELLRSLKARFEKNMNRHKGLEWAEVLARLEADTEKLWSLNEMERTGGEPDVVGHDEETGEYIFYDCSVESPQGRRNVCYDREALESRKRHKPEKNAIDMAAAMGIELLSEEQYRELQRLGDFDTKTSSWVKTPSDIRKLGGALFCDRRYHHVFVYHNGAPSYYAVRGFRGSLRV